MTAGEYRQVNVADARAHLVVALARLDEVDQVRIPAGKGSVRSGVLADVGKELLFIDHLLSKAKVLVLDEYHMSRGYIGPDYATEAKSYTVTVTPTEEGSS